MKIYLQIVLAISLVTLTGFQIWSVVKANQNPTSEVCPVNAISMINGKAYIDSSKCIGCRRCVDGIPIPSIQSTTQISNADSVISSPEIPEPAPTKTIGEQHITKNKNIQEKHKTHHVNPTKCIGCGLCVANCPTNAITLVDGKAIIDKDKCINCGICAKGNGAEYSGCPVSAICSPQTHTRDCDYK